MQHTCIYHKAIEIVANNDDTFQKALKANTDRYVNDPEMKDMHFRADVQPAAALVSAQIELVKEVFSVSEERIHADIEKALNDNYEDIDDAGTSFQANSKAEIKWNEAFEEYYCSNCKVPLESHLQEVWDDYQACPNSVPKPFRFCPECGVPITDEVAAE